MDPTFTQNLIENAVMYIQENVFKNTKHFKNTNIWACRYVSG